MVVEPTPALIKLILSQLDTDHAFERFCVRHYSEIEGINYVPTSYNYDNSRDGRSEFIVRTAGTSYICASLTAAKKRDPRSIAREILRKASDDFLGLITGDANPGKVRFCFTADITEQLRDRVLAKLKELGPGIPCEVSGLTQLVASIQKTPSAFGSVFATDIDATSRYLAHRPGGSNVVVGMRAALSTLLTKDAHTLRLGILSGMILQFLTAERKVSEEQIPAAVSAQLGLQQLVQPAYLSECLALMETRRWIERTYRSVSILKSGEEEWVKRQQFAAKRVVRAVATFRSLIESSIASELQEAEFTQIWRCVEDGLACMFHAHGLQLVKEVAELAAGTVSIPGRSEIRQGLMQLSKSVAALPIRAAKEVAELIPAMISDSAAPGFDLVCHLCTMYVASCSLSLDPNLHTAILHRIRTWDLFLDTHLLLSLLGSGEPDHPATRELISGWSAVGGVILVAGGVADEAAHHAAIADAKYRAWRNVMRRQGRSRGAIRRDVSLPPDDNVFLRSFVNVAESDYSPTQWRAYIANFTNGEADYVTIRQHITTDRGLTLIDDEGLSVELVDRLFRHALTIRQQDDDDVAYGAQDYRERSECDARLIAALIQRRQLSKRDGRYVAIISKSRTLRAICERESGPLGLESPVIPLSRLSFALALVPQTTMNLRALRVALFEGDFGSHVAATYRRARRLMGQQVSAGRFKLAEPAQLQRVIDNRLREEDVANPSV